MAKAAVLAACGHLNQGRRQALMVWHRQLLPIVGRIDF